MIQFIRGDTAANNAYIGAAGSFSIDMQANNIRLHDGETPGGTVIGSVDADGFIQSIESSGPIEITGTVTQPIISIKAATTSAAGSMSAADKTKLNGIEAGAQKNVGDAFNASGNYSSLRARGTTAADVGLGSVNNTSDANKPVSTAMQTALNAKAPINNPTFTGIVTIDEGEI